MDGFGFFSFSNVSGTNVACLIQIIFTWSEKKYYECIKVKLLKNYIFKLYNITK